MSSNAGYIPGLDSLRAVAVLAVMAGHADYFFYNERMDVFTGGFIGVDLFFVLSGFLITRILQREQADSGSVSLLRFYRNRALRLLPALFLLLAVLLPVLWMDGGTGHSTLLAAAASIVFYVYNWFVYLTLENVPGTGHLWSLSVEEQFYLLWPLLLIAGTRAGASATRWLWFCAAAVLFVALLRGLGWREGDSWLLLYLRTDLRADALLMGAALAFMERRSGGGFQALRVLAIPALLLFMLATLLIDATSGRMYLGGYSLLALLCALLVAAVAGGGIGGGWRWGNAIGRVSYGAYLYHMPLFTALASPAAAQLIDAAWLRLLLAFAVTFAAAGLSNRFVERPFLQRKR